jgi:DNA-binding winged helix-turn-helix (wHTH) protein/TolB-like protein/tetratricopeptide (TPR) repeat protein
VKECGVPTKEELLQGFRIGDWEVFPARGILRCGDQEESPEPKVFELLMALAIRDGDVVTKEDLVAEVWDGYPIGDDSITRCVAQLRKHLGEQGKSYVKTLTRRGYRLDVPVALTDDAPSTVDPREQATSLLNQGRLWMWFAGIVVIVIIGIWVGSPDSQRSIAVLPFENLTGDPSNQYRATGFKVELLHTLGNIQNLTVKDGKVSYPGLSAEQIAARLDVDFVLSGALQRVGDTLKFTYAVERGSNGRTVSAGEVAGEIGDEFALQGQLATMVRNDLVGESTQHLISENRDPNSAGFDRYMRGMHAFERRGRGGLDNLDAAVALFEESIELDSTFGPAYLSLASAYALLPDYRDAPLDETHATALELVERAVAVDPNLIAAASAVQGFVFHKQRRWDEAEAAYLRATTADLVDSTAFNWYSLMLGAVGRLDDALSQILVAQEIDPSSAIINSRTAIVYTWLGESERAGDYYDRASQLGASGEIHVLGQALLLMRAGRFEDAAELAGAGVELAGGNTEWIGPLFAAVNDPAARGDALAAIEAAFADSRLDPRLEIIARTMLDDEDGAMAVAMALAESGDILEMDVLFMQELRPLRMHADFTTLMDKLGVLDYWNNNGCAWKDDKVRCPS